MGEAQALPALSGERAVAADSTTRGGGADHAAFWVLNYVAVLLVVWLDWLTPAGTVVGILLVIPILLTSVADSARRTWLTCALALLGFLAAAWLGHGPLAPRDVWLPNRVLATLTLPASCLLALHVQGRRRAAERARDRAVQVSEMNRLLLSIVAHDLRGPLVMAAQAIDLARAPEGDLARGDASLLGDVEARLRRSIHSIDGLLDLFREELVEDGGSGTPGVRAVETAAEIEAIARPYGREAAMHGKTLYVDLSGVQGRVCMVDPRVLRHGLGILLDNAVRHARPGEIRVAGRLDDGVLAIHVRDPGPDTEPAEGGSGLGLALCRAVAARSGGTVEAQTDPAGGAVWTLRLPAHEAAPDSAR